jgi:hypothetical protein
MADPAAFTILLAYTCSIFCHLQGVQLWTPTTFSPSCRVPILMSTDCPMLSTACWHTNNQTTTTSKRRHALKKHIRKKHILCTSIFKQEVGGGSVGHSSTAPEVEPSLVSQSSVSYMINIGTGVYLTNFTSTPRISEQWSAYSSDCPAWCLTMVEGNGQQIEAGQQRRHNNMPCIVLLFRIHAKG